VWRAGGGQGGPPPTAAHDEILLDVRGELEPGGRQIE
jgi:hypothetical protein